MTRHRYREVARMDRETCARLRALGQRMMASDISVFRNVAELLESEGLREEFEHPRLQVESDHLRPAAYAGPEAVDDIMSLTPNTPGRRPINKVALLRAELQRVERQLAESESENARLRRQLNPTPPWPEYSRDW